MECPICGEDLPLTGGACTSCGYEEETFFLTEEVESSALRQRALQAPEEQPETEKARRLFKGKRKEQGQNGHVTWK